MLIKDEAALIVNLKTQLEKHNNIQFSKAEFEKVLQFLGRANEVLAKADLEIASQSPESKEKP